MGTAKKKASTRDTHKTKEKPCPTCTGHMTWVRIENHMTWWCLSCGAYSAFVKVEQA